MLQYHPSTVKLSDVAVPACARARLEDCLARVTDIRTDGIVAVLIYNHREHRMALGIGLRSHHDAARECMVELFGRNFLTSTSIWNAGVEEGIEVQGAGFTFSKNGEILTIETIARSGTFGVTDPRSLIVMRAKVEELCSELGYLCRPASVPLPPPAEKFDPRDSMPPDFRGSRAG